MWSAARPLRITYTSATGARPRSLAVPPPTNAPGARSHHRRSPSSAGTAGVRDPGLRGPPTVTARTTARHRAPRTAEGRKYPAHPYEPDTSYQEAPNGGESGLGKETHGRHRTGESRRRAPPAVAAVAGPTSVRAGNPPRVTTLRTSRANRPRGMADDRDCNSRPARRAPPGTRRGSDRVHDRDAGGSARAAVRGGTAGSSTAAVEHRDVTPITQREGIPPDTRRKHAISWPARSRPVPSATEAGRHAHGSHRSGPHPGAPSDTGPGGRGHSEPSTRAGEFARAIIRRIRPTDQLSRHPPIRSSGVDMRRFATQPLATLSFLLGTGLAEQVRLAPQFDGTSHT